MVLFSILASACAIFPFAFGYYINFSDWSSLLPILLTSSLSYLTTIRLIPTLKNSTRAAGLFGKDLNKTSSKEM
jgi:hypothetical protein